MSASANDAESRENLQRIMRLQVPVIAFLGEKRLKLGEILDLGVGAVIQLDKPATEPIDLMVNNQLVARGVAVRAGDHLGLKITEIAPVKETIRKLGRTGK